MASNCQELFIRRAWSSWTLTGLRSWIPQAMYPEQWLTCSTSRLAGPIFSRRGSGARGSQRRLDYLSSSSHIRSNRPHCDLGKGQAVLFYMGAGGPSL